MRRIATATRAVNLFGPGKDGFRASNPSSGLLATQLSADLCNDLQETLLHPIEEAGLVAGSDVSQLTQAIQALAGIGNVTSLSVTTVLTRGQRGLIHVNASAGNVDITLPAADRVMDFVIRRADNTGNRLRVYAAGTDVILHNVDINSSGYPFVRLFGAGDYWWLRSDGLGNWIPLGRLSAMPIGFVPTHSANLVPAGGYAPVHGTLLIRSDYPWLWDLASASSNIDTEANWTASKWGGFSSGDLATTFRLLELRGEFIRVWDDSRGITAQQIGEFIAHATESHTHLYNYHQGGGGGSGITYQGAGPNDGANVATSSFGTTETRPRSVALPRLLKII